MPPTLIKPAHKAISRYYDALREYREQRVLHEGAVETAFQGLLRDTAKPHKWFLVPKESLKVAGKTVIPDGTLRDTFNLHRGYWEAKDTDDDLNQEISKKIAKGYPLTNTIFEDTRRAVLFQGKKQVFEADLTDPTQIADLLNQFFGYVVPEHQSFEQAVEEFKEQVPDLARGLAKRIEAAHQDNARFQKAFADFFALCQTALNPNIRQAAVDEMLVQHLLTERLIRTVFDNPDFTHQNVIAAEVEKVIAALVSKSFNRAEFLKALDRFYVAIENAARTMPEFSEKQHFLNTVYERFFQGYSVELADTHGIVYTPQPIVDFMCASVAEVLESEFGKKLGDRDIYIIDPCTGTGNFIVNLLRRIPKKDLPRMYKEQLFANEVMLLPYYIAALNIEHAYYEQTGTYEPFEGLCFVDTLDLAEGSQPHLSFMTEANTQRVERQKRTPITVIIGNPPYNVGQINENDNNKNRKYPVVEKRIRETFIKGSTASLHTKLHDPYIKFFRWAIDRLQTRDGIVCFISNNNFVDQGTFDAMRRQLLTEFSELYHVDLHGNVRENPKLSGTTHNVFGIQVGVGITIAVRRGPTRNRKVKYYRVPENWRKEEKLGWLSHVSTFRNVSWRVLEPDELHTWLVPTNTAEFGRFIRLGSKEARSAEAQNVEAIFKTYSLGISTNRDSVVYGFQYDQLAKRVEQFCDLYNAEVDRYARKGKGKDIDSFLDYTTIKWSETLKAHVKRREDARFNAANIRRSTYRPFSTQYVYYDDILVDRPALFRKAFPSPSSEHENSVLCVPTVGNRALWTTFASRLITNLNLISVDAVQCFPFYIYAEDGSNRRENITDWALEQFRTHYGCPSRDREGAVSKPLANARGSESANREITKWDIFYYVYGVLHHPGYREKFADNLKRELPRIPLAPNPPDPPSRSGKGGEDLSGSPLSASGRGVGGEGFWTFADAGKKLADLHLDYEKLEPWPLKWIETPGVPLSYRVEDKMRLSKDKTQLKVNPSLTLGAIPPEVFHYRLGNRSALEWVIDQYRVKEDKRSGIRSDPNRADDPEYIVRLVGQVVRVSVETVRIVKGLPPSYST